MITVCKACDQTRSDKPGHIHVCTADPFTPGWLAGVAYDPGPQPGGLGEVRAARCRSGCGLRKDHDGVCERVGGEG